MLPPLPPTAMQIQNQTAGFSVADQILHIKTLLAEPSLCLFSPIALSDSLMHCCVTGTPHLTPLPPPTHCIHPSLLCAMCHASHNQPFPYCAPPSPPPHNAPPLPLDCPCTNDPGVCGNTIFLFLVLLRRPSLIILAIIPLSSPET